MPEICHLLYRNIYPDAKMMLALQPNLSRYGISKNDALATHGAHTFARPSSWSSYFSAGDRSEKGLLLYSEVRHSSLDSCFAFKSHENLWVRGFVYTSWSLECWSVVHNFSQLLTFWTAPSSTCRHNRTDIYSRGWRRGARPQELLSSANVSIKGCGNPDT